MATTWLISPNPIRDHAHPVLSVFKSDVDRYSGGLARLPLPPRKTGGGVGRIPVGIPAAKVELAVNVDTYDRYLRSDSIVYLWWTEQDDEQYVNRFLIVRHDYLPPEDNEYQVKLWLEASFRGGFLSTNDLLKAEKIKPDGDFANRNCGCRGMQEGLCDWLQRVLRRSPYVYNLSWTVGSRSNSGSTLQITEPRYFVSRVTKEGRVDWQCACGAWTEVEPNDRGRREMSVLSFADARSAHDHIRRLRNGVPQNWELIVAIFSFASATALVFGEVILPLINSHMH